MPRPKMFQEAMVKVSLLIPTDVAEQLEERARAEQMDRSTLLRRILAAHLKPDRKLARRK